MNLNAHGLELLEHDGAIVRTVVLLEKAICGFSSRMTFHQQTDLSETLDS